MRTIEFKSTQENFRKEYLGLKANTLRVLDKEDLIRSELLFNFEMGNLNLLSIKITNTKTGEYFTRVVTDVTKYEDWYIISWRHSLI